MADLGALEAWCRENRELLKRLIFGEGGVLFRGWGLGRVGEAERLVFESLSLDPMEQ